MSPRPDAAELLRAAAAGRRESAAAMSPDRPREAQYRAEFELEAETLDMAAAVVEGNLAPLYNWLPSWRWTDEMIERIDEDFTEGVARG